MDRDQDTQHEEEHQPLHLQELFADADTTGGRERLQRILDGMS